MTTNKRMPPLGQWIIGILFAIAAASAGYISLTMNWAFGLQFGIYAAVIFALSDCIKIMLPVVAAALDGWQARHRIAFHVALTISIVAASSSLLQDQAQHIKDTKAVSQAVATRQADLQRLQTRIEAITETRSSNTLADMVKAEEDKAKNEAKDGGCGPKCKSYQDEAKRYRELMADAQARERLQAQIADARKAISTTPDKAIGAADSIAAISGGDRTLIATVISIATAIFQLVILELIAAFSGDAGLLIRNAIRASRKPRNAKTANSQQLATREIAKPAEEIAKASGVGTKAYYMERLQKDFPELAAKVENCELSVYRASIAAGLRKPPKGRKWNANDYATNEAQECEPS